MTIGRFVGSIWLLAAIGYGCAFDLADVNYSPTKFQVSDMSEQSFTLTRKVPLKDTPCWYSRELQPLIQWQLVGSVAEGDVFRSKNQTLTLECSNIYEAYLVVREGHLVGFYLPVQKGFVGIAEPVQLPLKQ